MMTAKGKYCLKALACLASLEPGAKMQAIDIAKKQDIPKNFLDVILNDLRHANIISSKKGPGGGYMLARGASEIRIGEIIRLIDGPLAALACASRTAYRACEDCADVRRCKIRLMMGQVREAVSAILDSASVADLVVARDRQVNGKNLYRRNGQPARVARVSKASSANRLGAVPERKHTRSF
jgi:Rrf2 family protein